ncbi:hypothetical protein ACFQJ5_02075 [Halomicroarcula sp. GCM10025324]|uniref:hypothetical protein n=1 Tax=Haloarcula TaxID=2237 RepID=UPI0023E8EC18|nr:hypothetical protein [Halomicroarcula sp. ZS-22-S1]
MDWVERAGDLLYDGEAIETEVRVGSGGVVVTSHRLLAFTPDREGPNYRTVDRPNVEGVDVRTSGEGEFLEQGIKALVVGVVLVGAGQVVSLDSMVEGISLGSGEAAGAVGLGQMMGLLGGLLTLLAQLDDLMQLFGGLALALSVVVLGVYAWSRERVLVVGVAGGEDIVLSAPDDEDVVDQVRAAVLPGDAPADAARSTPVDDLLP